MSRRPLALAAILLVAAATVGPSLKLAEAQPPAAAAPVRFEAIDVFVESDEPLAAWQFELAEASGSMTVVGIENGESEAYAGTPWYDLDAVAADRADRIIVADYSLSQPDALPVGRTRIATVHVRLSGDAAPDFELNLIAAGNAEGRPIAATVTLELE